MATPVSGMVVATRRLVIVVLVLVESQTHPVSGSSFVARGADTVAMSTLLMRQNTCRIRRLDSCGRVVLAATIGMLAERLSRITDKLDIDHRWCTYVQKSC